MILIKLNFYLSLLISVTSTRLGTAKLSNSEAWRKPYQDVEDVQDENKE